MQIAVHDALNSIDPLYDSYAIVPHGSASASPEAAVAAAALGTLLGLLAAVARQPCQDRCDPFGEHHVRQPRLAGSRDGTSKTAGIAAGENSANAILALRSNDGSATPHLPYTLPPGPGVYQPTPNPEFPDVIVPSYAGWAFVTPFALNDASQFPIPPSAIFNLSSGAYTRDYNEVKQVGDALVRAAAPDSEESDIARFWPGGGANWNATARVIVDGMGFDMWQHARLFALLNIAEADGAISNALYKYTYNFWRPVTAIRWADDGNSRTDSDPAWRPFLVTPPYPDYPCALPTVTAASAAVLRRYLGSDDIAFSRTINAGAVPLPAPLEPLPAKSITRQFESLSEATSEAAQSRVYAGIHFRNGCYVGRRHGTQIGRFVFLHYLRPVTGHGH